jgi:2-dehydro-3-deoxyphosphogluconate aldolase/(4S)-4-hydroxy-2-oxoglutarate aldolase
MTPDELMAIGPFVPVITIERIEDAVPLARALVAGGVRALEVTLRTPVAIEAIKAMAEVEGAIVGAGTVLNPRDAELAAAAGAQFFISPGLTEPLARAAAELRLPYLAGIATPGDLMRGLDLGLERFKFFPAETYGGIATLKAFAGPFPQIKFCPTGGITEATAPDYLAQPNVVCVGGTWVTPKAAIDAGDWNRITELAARASGLKARS